MTSRKSAINEDLLQKPLGEINAAQFLQALGSVSERAPELAILPDKKKYELWTDEGVIPKITIAELIKRIRFEKKKLELEKRFIIEHFKRPAEFEIDPGTQVISPVIREQLVEEIASEVVRRLGR